MEKYNYESESAIHNNKVFNDIKESIGLKVKSLRSEKQITQQELADVFGLSRNHLAQVETGRTAPSLKMLYDLSIYFNCSMDYLIGLSLVRQSKGLPSSNIYEIIDKCDVSFGQRHIVDDEKHKVIEFIKDCLYLMDKYK